MRCDLNYEEKTKLEKNHLGFKDNHLPNQGIHYDKK